MDVSQINQKSKLLIVNCTIVTKKLQLKNKRFGQKLCDAFIYLRFVFEILHFNQTCTPFFHAKRRY